MTTGLDKKYNTFINIFNPKKKLVGGAPLHVKRAETPLSTSFFLVLKCFICPAGSRVLLVKIVRRGLFHCHYKLRYGMTDTILPDIFISCDFPDIRFSLHLTKVSWPSILIYEHYFPTSFFPSSSRTLKLSNYPFQF